MATTNDRFETRHREISGRVTAGWRVTRYSFGYVTVQHLRSGRSKTGVIDCFGNVIYPENNIHSWRIATEEIVPFYESERIPPHWTPGKSYI